MEVHTSHGRRIIVRKSLRLRTHALLIYNAMFKRRWAVAIAPRQEVDSAAIRALLKALPKVPHTALSPSVID